MNTTPAEISQTDWLATPANVITLIFAQQQEIQALRQKIDYHCGHLSVLATKMVSVPEQIARNSRNFSKPLSSVGQVFSAPERRKSSGRKLGG